MCPTFRNQFSCVVKRRAFTFQCEHVVLLFYTFTKYNLSKFISRRCKLRLLLWIIQRTESRYLKCFLVVVIIPVDTSRSKKPLRILLKTTCMNNIIQNILEKLRITAVRCTLSTSFPILLCFLPISFLLIFVYFLCLCFVFLVYKLFR